MATFGPNLTQLPDCRPTSHNFVKDAKLAYFKVRPHVRFVEADPTVLSSKIKNLKMRQVEIEARSLPTFAAPQTT
jgi:hypothetical protein